MSHDLLQVVRVQGIEDVEEVITWRTLAFRILTRKVGHHFGVLGKHRIQVLDAELVVPGHLDLLDDGLLHQLLLAGQDLLEEVFIHDGLVRQVELEATEG